MPTSHAGGRIRPPFWGERSREPIRSRRFLRVLRESFAFSAVISVFVQPVRNTIPRPARLTSSLTLEGRAGSISKYRPTGRYLQLYTPIASQQGFPFLPCDREEQASGQNFL